MKTTLIMRINAIVLIAGGIGFGLYGPLMMALFTIPELNINTDVYWQIAGFARMFGAALFGFGLLILSLCEAFPHFERKTQRGILSSLILGHIMAAYISITQTVSIWGPAAGWVLSGIFCLFLIAYIAAIVLLPSTLEAEMDNKENQKKMILTISMFEDFAFIEIGSVQI